MSSLPWLYSTFCFLFPYLPPSLYSPPPRWPEGLPPSLPPSFCPSLWMPFCKYFCMLSHMQRLRVEDMKPEANKTFACFSLVTNSSISLLNSRIYHAAVHDSGSPNCSCIVYILSQSLSDNLGLIILPQYQSYGGYLIKSISHATRHLEISEESPDTDLAFIYSLE